jgi:hypothetical protein
MVENRDQRYGVDTKKKREARKDISPEEIHPDADSCWK